MPITFDDQLRVLDKHIERQKKFVKENVGRYSSNYLAIVASETETFEVIRETVRQARQNQQMTGMNGQRIE